MSSEARSHSKSSNRRGRNQATVKPEAGPVESMTIHPLLLEYGRASELLVIDPVTAIVCNSSYHRNYLRKVLAV